MAIFNHHLDAMAQVAAAYLGRGAETAARIRVALASYWSDKLAVTWDIQDVLDECPALSRDEARAVLDHLLRHHDATLGVRWETIRLAAARVVPDFYDRLVPEDDDDEEEPPCPTDASPTPATG